MTLWVLMYVFGLFLGVGVAYWAGYQIANRQLSYRVEEQVDRMYRIEPPERTPGQPTNMNAAPSRVRKSRYRNVTWKG